MPTGSTSEGLRDLAERCRLWSERAAKQTVPSMRPTVWEELAATAAENTARVAVLPPAFALHLVGVTFCQLNGHEAYLPHSPARPRVSHDVNGAVEALLKSLQPFGDDTARARKALATLPEGRDPRVHALRQLAHDLLVRADRLDVCHLHGKRAVPRRAPCGDRGHRTANRFLSGHKRRLWPPTPEPCWNCGTG